MNGILSNKLGKLVVVLISHILALTLFVLPNGAVAQEPKFGLAGACVLHSRDQGPWDCKAEQILRPMCLGREKTGYDAAWKLVGNNDEATIFLKAVYSYYNDPLKFARWLACQGFYTDLGSKAAGGFHQVPDSELIYIRLGYVTKAAPYPLSWLNFLAYGADITMYLDDFGQIKDVKFDYSVE